MKEGVLKHTCGRTHTGIHRQTRTCTAYFCFTLSPGASRGLSGASFPSPGEGERNRVGPSFAGACTLPTHSGLSVGLAFPPLPQPELARALLGSRPLGLSPEALQLSVALGRVRPAVPAQGRCSALPTPQACSSVSPWSSEADKYCKSFLAVERGGTCPSVAASP